MDVQTVLLTLRLASWTTLLLLAMGLPLSWWLASGRSGPRSIIQAAVTLPLVLPPTVLGFYLLVLLGPLTVTGRTLTRWIGHPLAFTFSGLVLGSMVYSLPFVVQPLTAGFRSVPLARREAAAGLGAGPWQVFRTITLPAARGSVLAAAMLAFLHTVGEFGVVLMIGGDIPGSTRTLSIALYDLVEDGRYGAASHTAAALTGVALLALAVIYSAPGRASRSAFAE